MCPGRCPNGCHCLPGRPSRAQAQSQPFRAEGDVCLGRCPLYHWACLREQPNPAGGRALFSLQVCLPVFLNLLPTFKNYNYSYKKFTRKVIKSSLTKPTGPFSKHRRKHGPSRPQQLAIPESSLYWYEQFSLLLQYSQ